MADLRYPIGNWEYTAPASDSQRQSWIGDLAAAPAKLRDAVHGLSPAQLETPYRPEGWTVRQVVHHLPDSHMNAYVRFRLALTEPEPVIKPYEEARWATLTDASTAPIDVSLQLLEALHQRWVMLLRSMTPEQWQCAYRHPELGRVSLEHALAMYAWHGKHHVAHVTGLREREKF